MWRMQGSSRDCTVTPGLPRRSATAFSLTGDPPPPQMRARPGMTAASAGLRHATAEAQDAACAAHAALKRHPPAIVRLLGISRS